MKKLLAHLSLGLSFVLTVAACTSPNHEQIKDAKNPTTITSIPTDAKPTKLSKPFTVYNELGEHPGTLKYKVYNSIGGGGEVTSSQENTFDNLYKAIRVAAENSTTKNRLQVQDANHTQVFIRQKYSDWFVFDGHDYVGTDSQRAAQSYAEKHKNSYAISGTGKDYSYLGRDDYSQNNKLTPALLELNAGAYNYMFSENGVNKGSNGEMINGFGYASAYCRLSEMRYKPTNDNKEGGWNAYIFIDLGSAVIADLGLIGNLIEGTVKWRLVRNCMNKAYHGGDTFHVYNDQVPTSSNQKNEKGEYYGFDDLHFEVMAAKNGWILNVTNLRTKVVSSFADLHMEGGNPVVQNPDNGAGVYPYHRALVAASYCPVVGNIWDFDCGAKLENVRWDHIELQRYNPNDNIDEYRLAEAKDRFEFFPDANLREGYSQGAFASSFKFETRSISDHPINDVNGNPFAEDYKSLSMSVDYNNKW